jgi:hypothetical protein
LRVESRSRAWIEDERIKRELISSGIRISVTIGATEETYVFGSADEIPVLLQSSEPSFENVDSVHRGVGLDAPLDRSDSREKK